MRKERPILIFILLGLVAISFYLCCILPAQWVEIRRVEHPLGIGKRILQLSDLHVEKLWVNPKRLERIIAGVKPDYIFLTGDYTQRARHLRKVDRYLSVVEASGIPAYAVLGNHDYRLQHGQLQRLLALFEQRGIPVLRNESIRLRAFRLIGIDDDYSKKSDVKKAFKGILPHEKCVVITHDPTVTLKMRKPYDYLLSGHFHGGQFRLPWVFRLRRKGPLPLRGIISGLHHDARGSFYISRGLGQTGVNARFLIRSEVTVHEI